MNSMLQLLRVRGNPTLSVLLQKVPNLRRNWVIAMYGKLQFQENILNGTLDGL